MTGGKPKLRKGYRETLAAAREYVEANGATMSYDLRGRHPKIIVERGGVSASSAFASTPRTSEYWNHGRRAAQQALRALAAASGTEARQRQDREDGLDPKGLQMDGQ